MTGKPLDPGGWSGLWSAGRLRGDALTRALAERIRRESRLMKWTTAVQSAAGVLILGFVGRVALEHPDPYHLAWAGGVALLVVTAWVFLLANRRGVWGPYGETTQSFVAVVAERARRRLRLVGGVTALAVAHLLFTAWLAWWGFRIRPDRPLHPADAATYVGAVALLAAILVWAVWYRRRVRRELSRINDIASLLG